MSFVKQALLQCRVPLLEARRFRGKINLKRPRKPHFERQLLIDVSKPYFLTSLPTESDKCQAGIKLPWHKVIDNPFERILARECRNWFESSKVIVFLHMNPIAMQDKVPIYIELRKQDMHLRTYGKKIVSMATEGTKFEEVNKLFVSQQEIIFSYNENVAKLLKILKKTPQMVIMAGIVNNQFLSKNELVAFSQLPDLKTSQAQLCSILQSAASGVVSQLTQHQQVLVSQLEQHVEQLKKASAPSKEEPAPSNKPVASSKEEATPSKEASASSKEANVEDKIKE